MRQSSLRTVLLLTLAGPALLMAQTSAPLTAAPAPAAIQTLQLPSQIVQPALNGLLGTLDSVRLEKWKASSEVRQRAEANIQSLRSDLNSKLPSLLHVADGAPSSLASLLPAARNLDALYDVVLRVAETAHISAPRQQSSDLDAALANLDRARRDLSAHILTSAQASEAEMQSLRQQLATRAAAPPTPEPRPCPKLVYKKKHVYKKSPAE